MAGRRQKHPDDLVFRRGGRVKALTVVESTNQRTPPCPIAANGFDPVARKAAAEVRRVWRDLWRSNLSGAFKDTDLPSLRRWAWYLHQWLVTTHELESQGAVIPGAMGGMVINPLARYVRQCEVALREFEKSFGMDALARLRLGLKLVDEAKAVRGLKSQPRAPTEMPA